MTPYSFITPPCNRHKCDRLINRVIDIDWELAQLVLDPFPKCNTNEANSNPGCSFSDTWMPAPLWFQPMSSPFLKITAVTSLFWPITAPTQSGIRGNPQRREEEWLKMDGKKKRNWKRQEGGFYLKVIRLVYRQKKGKERVRPDWAQTTETHTHGI